MFTAKYCLLWLPYINYITHDLISKGIFSVLWFDMISILPDFRKIIEGWCSLPVKISLLGYADRRAYPYTQIVLFLKERWIFHCIFCSLYPKLWRYNEKNRYTAHFTELCTRYRRWGKLISRNSLCYST